MVPDEFLFKDELRKKKKLEKRLSRQQTRVTGHVSNQRVSYVICSLHKMFFSAFSAPQQQIYVALERGKNVWEI